MERPFPSVHQIILDQRSPLERIAAVQYQSISVLFYLWGYTQKSRIFCTVHGIIYRKNMAMDICSIIEAEFLLHAHPLASLTRILVEIHSTMSTSTIRPVKMAPASSQR